MAPMPGAVWQPKAIGNRARRSKGRAVVFHVAVSEAQSLMPGASADWHFYVARDGRTYQYIDTDFQSWATGAANSSVISVETQGGVRNADSEPWSPQACAALARIARWAHDTEGVPLQLMPDSRPGSRGIGYHRLGVDPWRVSGGELWSSARGKICPGAAKIAQIPQIIAAAAGGAVPTPEEPDLDADQNNRLTEAWLNAVAAKDAAAKCLVQITALTEVVRQVAQNQGGSIDLAAVEAIVEKGVQDAIAGIETTVTVRSDA